MDTKTITTTCTRDCPNTCGLIASVEKGKLTGLTASQSHPFTKGVTCHKAGKYINRVYSEERITSPMIRSSSGWDICSWDDALDLIAGKMKTFKHQDGPESILYYQGYGERTGLKLLNRYFFNLFGGVTTLRGSLCGGTGQASQNLDLGHRISHDPLDHYNSKAIILWARNPVVTNIGLVPIIQAIRKRGGRIIVIDPFKNKTASLADYHIAPAPGKDVYLAMAAAKIIFDRGMESRTFLTKHSKGAEEYKAVIDRYTVTGLCASGGFTEADASYLAETMTAFSPASILLGWGLHRHKNAHYSIRAIDALAAIAGTIGIEGGGVSQGFEEYGPYDQKYWGDDLNPPRRTLLMPKIGEELLKAANPKIRMIFSTAANPVCMAPNSNKVMKAWKRIEFKVYSGHFMDDTAELADVFLPATTFLEEDDVMASYGHNYVGAVNKAIDPVGESLSDFAMFSKLAERFSFHKQFSRPAEDWLRDICSPIIKWGGNLDDLKKTPFRVPEPMAPYLDKQFPTASGKFEFMTEFDQQMVDRKKNKTYPYTLLTVAANDAICSERTLLDHSVLPKVLIHPEEAALNGVNSGDEIIIKSQHGEIRAKLHTDKNMRRDCVIAERGGWIKAGHGLNRLTSDIVSTIGDGTPYYETRITILSPDN